MTDTLTKAQRRADMAKIRSRDTGVERAVRRLTFALGYRYRPHARELPGRPDMVFHTRKKAIFVQGCFWHQHDAARAAVGKVSETSRQSEVRAALIVVYLLNS